MSSQTARASLSTDKQESYGSGAAHSRSTSPGSSVSDSQKSFNAGQWFPTTEMPLLPAWSMEANDYAAPWSRQQESELPEIRYPQPTADCIFANILGELSLPGLIGPPPGLEDLVAPEEAAARLAAAELALRHDLARAEADVLMQAAHYQDTWTNLQAQHLSPEMLQLQGQEFSDENFHLENHSSPFLASDTPSGGWVTDVSATWTMQAQSGNDTPQADFGFLEYPTVGSQDHHFGTCRPCAFLYTKGCTNGVLCPFCHLCDVGARKRRSKAHRAAKKLFEKATC